jgi:hypothetical protein
VRVSISTPNGRSRKNPVLAASAWEKYTIKPEKIKRKGTGNARRGDLQGCPK